MGQKRQYKSYVLERSGVEGSFSFTIVDCADSGTDARNRCIKIAGDNPGKVYVACNLWPAIMSKEIKKLAYLNPDDPDGKLSESPDDIDFEDQEDAASDSSEKIVLESKEVKDSKDAKDLVKNSVKSEIKVEKVSPKIEEKIDSKQSKVEEKVQIKESVSVVKKDEKKEVKEESKVEVKAEKKVDFEELFEGSDDSESSFANTDSANQDEDSDGIPEDLF